MPKLRVVNPAVSAFNNVMNNVKATSVSVVPVKNYPTIATKTFSNLTKK